jgi:outer membrane murein-binding lipoprotein Lpp
MSVRRAWAGAAAVVVLLVSGCTVSEPDPPAWRDQARQTLDDMASQVATARLTITQLEEDRLPSSYGITVLADAEQAAGTAEETLSSVQAPRRLHAVSEKVLELLGRAVDAVQETRAAVVAGHYERPGLVAKLQRLQTALDDQRATL